MVNEILDVFDGYKSYIVSTLTVLFGLSAYLLDKMPFEEAIPIILLGLGFGSYRSAMKKQEL